MNFVYFGLNREPWFETQRILATTEPFVNPFYQFP